jgi:hypothetical protein
VGEHQTWDQTRPQAKKGGDKSSGKIGCGGVGCITVFYKKTEGTAAVEGQKMSCNWCFGVLQLPTIGKERRERRDKETGCGDAGGITVFGKKTEGTAAVEG